MVMSAQLVSEGKAVVMTVSDVEDGGHGGSSKVGHGWQSGKHLAARLADSQAVLGGSSVAYPPYIIPQSLTPSQQTVRVLQSSSGSPVGEGVGATVVPSQGGGDGAASGSQTS